MLPPSSVDYPGFQRFFQKVIPEFHIPCRNTMVNTHLASLYNKIRAVLEPILRSNEVEAISLTTDLWENKRYSFINVSGHFFYKNKLRSCNLECKVMQKNHTKENICDAMDEVLQEWGIGAKVRYITCDGAPNVQSGLKLLRDKRTEYQFEVIWCLTHRLNLCSEDVIQENKNKKARDRARADKARGQAVSDGEIQETKLFKLLEKNSKNCLLS